MANITATYSATNRALTFTRDDGASFLVNEQVFQQDSEEWAAEVMKSLAATYNNLATPPGEPETVLVDGKVETLRTLFDPLPEPQPSNAS
jgi:hypothetical protein